MPLGFRFPGTERFVGPRLHCPHCARQVDVQVALATDPRRSTPSNRCHREVRRDGDAVLGTVAATTLDELAEAAVAGGFDAISATPAMALGAGRRSGPTVSYVDALARRCPDRPRSTRSSPAYRRFFEPGTGNCFRAAALTGAPVLNVAHFLGGPAPLTEMVDAFGALCAQGRRRRA